MSCEWVDGKAVCKTAMALLLELVSDGSAFALLSPKVTKAEWSASTQLWLRCGAFARIRARTYPAKRTANGFVYEGMKLINDGFIDITEDDELKQGCPFI